MIWFVLCGIALFILTLHLSWKIWMWSFQLNYLPSLPTVPWLGSMPFAPSSPSAIYKYFSDMDAKFNNHYCIWVGPIPFIRSGKLEFVSEMLKSKELIAKSVFYRVASAWLGESVLILTGDAWKHRRNLINPAFHVKILNRYIHTFSKHALNINKRLSEIESIGVGVDIQPLMSKLTLGIICETSMGINMNSSENLSKYCEAFDEVKFEFQKLMAKPWFWNECIFKMTRSGKNYYSNLKIMEDFTVNVINKKVEESENEHKESTSFLDILLDAHDLGEIDIQGVVAEVNTFMFAGHDTTSITLSWALYAIGLHPDIQNKLYDEVKSCLSEDVREKIFKANYLEMVIKEVLRMYTPSTNPSRLIDVDAMVDGQQVRKGTSVMISIHALHHNPEFWTNPLEFNPERFSDANCENRKPFTFIPFSAGTRNCVGQKFAMLEMKVILFEILSEFEIITIRQDVKPCLKILFCSENGIWIKFKKRE